ncbi:MAG: ACT domain-containing protein [Deltaproteobacteria bacterium]|nr:ACT domain-containing protein [Candidatus Anaeroferrophillacea bacterium]
MSGRSGERERAVVLVVGTDRTGIVAQVSDFLWKENVNIEDINQKIMQGVFVMTMLVDLTEARTDLGVMGPKLERFGQQIDMAIHIQHLRIFEVMHRV